MALCPRCGGVKDLYPLPSRAAGPLIEADPYCPECGHPRHITCQRCDGSGYVDASVSVRLIREYCARCGGPMAQNARLSCPECGGSGRTGHFCSGWAWYARPHRQKAKSMVATSFSRERTVALRPKHSRALVKIGR